MVGGIVYSVVVVHTILTCQLGYGVASKVGQISTYSKANTYHRVDAGLTKRLAQF